jgi:crotonobetainyl-CoA:carnitine CoA-transferase CaiB-like acyl-CoA transferase
MPGFDLVLQALSGVMSYTGEAGGAPVRMGIPMGDLGGSMFAGYAIAAALYAREKTGTGRRIDLSLLDCLVALHTYVVQYYFTSGAIPQLIGSGHMSVVPYRAYKTRDSYLTIAVFVEKFWEKLCQVIGRPELGDDPRYNSVAQRLKHRQEVDRILEERFVTKTTDEWVKLLYEAGVPAAPVNTIDRVFQNPQVLARNMVVEINHPKCGRIKNVGNPVKQPPLPDGPYEPPPLLGQHTEEILNGLLGYSQADIVRLRSEVII